jgi:hypothetical protein
LLRAAVGGLSGFVRAAVDGLAGEVGAFDGAVVDPDDEVVCPGCFVDGPGPVDDGRCCGAVKSLSVDGIVGAAAGTWA